MTHGPGLWSFVKQRLRTPGLSFILGVGHFSLRQSCRVWDEKVDAHTFTYEALDVEVFVLNS